MKWILVGLFLVVAAPAFAQGGRVCGEREDFLKQLEEKHQEVVRYIAVSGTGALMEWTISPNGEWSMLVTIPSGPTCIVAYGSGWQERKPFKKTGVRV